MRRIEPQLVTLLLTRAEFQIPANHFLVPKLCWQYEFVNVTTITYYHLPRRSLHTDYPLHTTYCTTATPVVTTTHSDYDDYDDYDDDDNNCFYCYCCVGRCTSSWSTRSCPFRRLGDKASRIERPVLGFAHGPL